MLLQPKKFDFSSLSSIVSPSFHQNKQTKLAKYWNKQTIIETKNTTGDLQFITSITDNFILSIVNGDLLSLNTDTLAIEKRYSSQDEKIISFAYNTFSREIICLMDISMIRIFNLDTEQCTNKFKISKTLGKIVKLDPTGNFFAVVTSNNSIIWYNTKNYTLEANFVGHTGIIYDIKFNPVKDKFILYSCSEDNSVRVWNILLKKCVGVLEPHTNSVRHIEITNDGGFWISGTFDNKIFIWKLFDFHKDINVKSKEYKPKIYELSMNFESMIYYTKNIKNKSIPSLWIGGDNGLIAELNWQTGEMSQPFNTGVTQSIIQMHYSIHSNKVHILTNEQILITLKTDLVNIEIKKSKIERVYPCYCQEILSVKYLTQTAFVFSSNDSLLKYFDIENQRVSIIEGHRDFIMSITVKKDFIVTTSKDNTIRIWRYAWEKPHLKFVCETIGIFKGHSETVNCADLTSKNSNHLVSGCKDGSIKIWDVSSIITSERKWVEIKESKVSWVAHEDEVNVVKYSPNEKLIASCSYDKTIKIYNHKLEILSTIKGHKRGITDISFSQYAKVLVSSSTDKTIKIWNLNDYSCLNTLEGHLSSVWKVDWIYHGTHLISSGGDGLVKLWNIKTSECLSTIDAHEGKVWAMDIARTTHGSQSIVHNEKAEKEDRLMFWTGCTDSSIVLWNDITSEKENEILAIEEQTIHKKNELNLLKYNEEYIEALKLSMELNHKHDFISIFKAYVDDILSTANTNLKKVKNNVDIIIQNRRIIDKEEEISDHHLLQNYKKSLNSIINNEEIKAIIIGNTDKIIEIVRDFNIKSTMFLYSQLLLKMLLKYTNWLKLLKSKNSDTNIPQLSTTNMLKQKRNRNLPQNLQENLEIINMYSSKHFDRIERQIIKTYMVDYSVNKIKLL